MKPGGGPAFPSRTEYSGGRTLEYEGMRLRDWFAGQVLASEGVLAIRGILGNDTLAKEAYAIADAMLAERSKL